MNVEERECETMKVGVSMEVRVGCKSGWRRGRGRGKRGEGAIEKPSLFSS